jgi:hypothetical protein
MRRATKILCLAVFLTLQLSGTSFALPILPINETDHFYLGAVLWADLNVQVEETSGGLYSYRYTLTNFLAEHPIHSLLLPVVSGGYSGPTMGTGSGVQWSSYWDDGYGTLTIYFTGSQYQNEINKDESTIPIIILSGYYPEPEIVTIFNQGAQSGTSASTAIGGTGGGNSGVPEPATMLFLGISVLGVGAYRYLKSVKRP